MQKNPLKKHSGNERLKNNIPKFVMLAPFLIAFFLFTALPILSSIALSFTSYDMISLPKFIGIDNYRRMIVNDNVFAVTVRNTLVFAIVAGPLGFLLTRPVIRRSIPHTTGQATLRTALPSLK